MRVALGRGSQNAKLCLLICVDQETEKGGDVGPGYKIQAPLPSKLFLTVKSHLSKIHNLPQQQGHQGSKHSLSGAPSRWPFPIQARAGCHSESGSSWNVDMTQDAEQ